MKVFLALYLRNKTTYTFTIDNSFLISF